MAGKLGVVGKRIDRRRLRVTPVTSMPKRSRTARPGAVAASVTRRTTGDPARVIRTAPVCRPGTRVTANVCQRSALENRLSWCSAMILSRPAVSPRSTMPQRETLSGRNRSAQATRRSLSCFGFGTSEKPCVRPAARDGSRAQRIAQQPSHKHDDDHENDGKDCAHQVNATTDHPSRRPTRDDHGSVPGAAQARTCST